ncbi:hypothetical protein L2E82_36489 [Cichorium intybus]|uniref:Uncharacterized protein n=1 Tax=Cichorium intybus TaxID=13427 RepID=A0ACB9BRY6_CICIN|nr:hypothetical protein L2E82_36489 [Cichorium intybus]
MATMRLQVVGMIHEKRKSSNPPPKVTNSWELMAGLDSIAEDQHPPSNNLYFKTLPKLLTSPYFFPISVDDFLAGHRFTSHLSTPPPPPPPPVIMGKKKKTLGKKKKKLNQQGQSAGGQSSHTATATTSANDTTTTATATEYLCDHVRIDASKYGIDIHTSSLTMKHDKDPDKYLVEFTYDAHFAGSIVLFFSGVTGEYDDFPKKLRDKITTHVERGMGQKFIQEEGTGVYLPSSRIGIIEACCLTIQTHSERLKDGSMHRVSQSTHAVFQIYAVGEVRVSMVLPQLVWVNGKRYFHVNALSEGCSVCLAIAFGKLKVSKHEIRRGSGGTVVYEGTFDGMAVAVKKMLKVYHDVADKQIPFLRVSDFHPNIVRFYHKEVDKDFVYIALERCTCTLYDLILPCDKPEVEHFKQHLTLRKSNGYPSKLLVNILRDIVRGLAHLHKLGIVHGDLKPQNVLICKDTCTHTKETYFTAKISDMGISKRLRDSKTIFASSIAGKSCDGSRGWQAPEQILNEEGQMSAVDLFSFGCLLFFGMTGGQHPYGDDIYERDINIVNDKKDLLLVDDIPEAVDLISCLLDPNPESRPTAADVYNHPLFWDHKTRLNFLRNGSYRGRR